MDLFASISPLRDHSTFEVQRFLSTADRIAPAFYEKTSAIGELVDSSILFSDGLCVCVLCEMFGVDCLVESGTGFGGSTEMFARYFAEHEKVSRIWSVDLQVNPVQAWLLARLGIRRLDPHVWSTRRRARQMAQRRLSRFRHVELAHGDAMHKLPAMVAALAGQGARVGIVIDGPKEERQMLLAHQLLALSPAVCFAALDDVGPMFDESDRYARFVSSPYAVFATSDRSYYARYGWVNGGRLPGRMRGKPNHTGYGLGILVNRRLDDAEVSRAR